jgi:hypothetical protein
MPVSINSCISVQKEYAIREIIQRAAQLPAQSITNCSLFPFPHVVFGAEPRIARPIDCDRTLEANASYPAPNAELHGPHFGIGQDPQAARPLTCCPPSCEGQQCVITRTQLRKLATSLSALEHKAKACAQTEHHSSDEVSCPL